MQLDLLIGFPAIIVDIVDLARPQLHLLNVLVPAQRVNLRRIHANGREERLLLDHGRSMNDIPIDVLEAIVAHAPNQEPGANVWVLLDSQWVQPLAAPINKQRSEVAGKLAAVFSDQAPFGELFLLRTLNVKSSNLIAAELEPEHIVGQVENEVVLLGILPEELALSHQVLL